MFSTKRFAENWVADYAPGKGVTTKKTGKFWRLIDASGAVLSEEEIHLMEARKQ